MEFPKNKVPLLPDVPPRMDEITPLVPPPTIVIPGESFTVLLTSKEVPLIKNVPDVYWSASRVRTVPLLNVMGLVKVRLPPLMEPITPVVPPPITVIPGERFSVLLTGRVMPFRSESDAVKVPAPLRSEPAAVNCSAPKVRTVPLLNVMGLEKIRLPPLMAEIVPWVPPPTISIPGNRLTVLLTRREVPPLRSDPDEVKNPTLNPMLPLLNVLRVRVPVFAALPREEKTVPPYKRCVAWGAYTQRPLSAL